METALRILLLEDVPSDAELERQALQRARILCETRCVETRADFLRELDAFNPDLVLSDFTLPNFDGLSALRLVRDRDPDLPFIFVSGTIGEERAVEALKNGATDYVVKTNLARLPAVVLRALREVRERKRHARQEARLARLSRLRAMQSAIASAIVRIRDPHELFQAACTLAVEHGGFRMAWVGRVTPETLAVEPVAWSGYNEGYLEEVVSLPEAAAEDCSGKGAALRQGNAVTVRDIEHDRFFVPKQSALARGYRSMIALPLIAESRVMAVFKIYSAEAGFFDADEVAILNELAGDLSFALDHRAREERLSHFAYHDMLTGLPNRRRLREHLDQEIARARRLKNMVAVVFIDLDDFKAVNDTLGHSAGDRVLKEVAARISSCIREGDLAARLGGDEFVMVLPLQPGQETLAPMMQRVLDSVSRVIRIGNRKVSVGCSIGAAIYPRDGKDSESLMRGADTAMYRVKEQARSNLELFDAAPAASPAPGHKVGSL